MGHKRGEISEVTAGRRVQSEKKRENSISIDIFTPQTSIGRSTPVIGFGERGFLVSEEPTVAVCGMDDVNVSPFERSGRRGQMRGYSAPRKLTSVPVCVVSTGGDRADGCKEPKEGGSRTQFGQVGQHGTVGEVVIYWLLL